MIRRVVFLGDVCRGAQAWNVVRIANLFGPVFKQIGVECSVFVSEVNKLTVLEEWFDGWKASLREDQEFHLDGVDLGGAAVVGFEIPENDLACLSRIGVPWVNLAIHPLRFLDDLYFEVKTSFDCDLQKLSVGRGLIDLCVNVVRLRYGRGVDQQSGAATLAIFGQTPIDRSVYFDGEFKSLDHYLQRLDELAASYERIVFRPHPNAADSEVDRLICERYAAVRHAGGDVYDFFVSGGISTACAISSSVLEEAPFFGIKSEYLEPRAKRFGVPVSYRRMLDEQNFWVQGLLGRAEPVVPEVISSAVPAGFLRRSIESWGYLSEDKILNSRVVEALQLSQAAVSQAQAARDCAKHATDAAMSLGKFVTAHLNEAKDGMLQEHQFVRGIDARVGQLEKSLLEIPHDLGARDQQALTEGSLVTGERASLDPADICNDGSEVMRSQILEALSAIREVLIQAADHQAVLSRKVACLRTDALRGLDQVMSASERRACHERIRDIQTYLPSELDAIEEQSSRLKELLALLKSGIDGFIAEQRG